MMENPEIHSEQMQIFDPLCFKLVMDGVYASIRLNSQKPDRGMTKEQAEANLAKWFPEASEIRIEEP